MLQVVAVVNLRSVSAATTSTWTFGWHKEACNFESNFGNCTECLLARKVGFYSRLPCFSQRKAEKNNDNPIFRPPLIWLLASARAPANSPI